MSAETYTDNLAGKTYLLDSLRETIVSAKEVLLNKATLVKEKLKSSVETTAKHSLQLTVFAWLVALSTIPFVAFLVLGLGQLLNDRYWLSSLIVSVIFAVVGRNFGDKEV
ncbi:MAG: hypothetical protein H7061_03850 [Bdellovibrionaceae bacterium]|nr:hypothetical protein [Bdellovibrio sp.]